MQQVLIDRCLLAKLIFGFHLDRSYSMMFAWDEVGVVGRFNTNHNLNARKHDCLIEG